jgi:hypothetical protein
MIRTTPFASNKGSLRRLEVRMAHNGSILTLAELVIASHCSKAVAKIRLFAYRVRQSIGGP